MSHPASRLRWLPCRLEPPAARVRRFVATTARVARISAAACLVGLIACAPVRPTAPAVEFVIVRHAEKRSDGASDPRLTDAGSARALRLAKSLASAPVTAVYATSFQRTQLTAAPVAAGHGLTVTTYDAKQAAAGFAAMLRQRHANGTVLVVGHSNTVPDIAAALCQCAVTPMADDEYGRRLQVLVDASGKAVLTDTRLP